MTTDVVNACIVSPGVLWRGGKPDEQGASALLSKGVGTVVNLEMLHSDKGSFQQATVASSRQVDYFEVPEWEPNVIIAPGWVDDSVAEFIAIVRTQPRPVYVHCRSGQNRTGVMVAAYRIIEEGLSVEAAIDEMGRYNGFWFKQDAKYLREMAAGRLAQIKALADRKQHMLQRAARFDCGDKGCVLR
ncbi:MULTISPECIES: fused DSP-PTPase phosphatase/NAD kinase-like protein [Aquabacterium]|uniref:fused DSP-PTPase phosphatase/NAD kinase-like protein n=1 Tax=Aquabacterium TaxID=92793 RepID=UPI000718D7F6|nr:MULTISPECIES: dual specificity protein phosphatase family protein [Aquabacterium]MBU0916726.1 dual specificity protein phosphatase family protein [Gammaproteobacteria bacterium]